MRVAPNTVVTIDYTLTDPQGQVLDTSNGAEPLSYLHGVGGVIPGLEAALDGKVAGDEVKAVVPPEQGYGPRKQELIQPVSRGAFGGVEQITPGMQFQANTSAGPRPVTVTAVDGDQVTIDANHPLAGVTLHFDVRIVNVRDATPTERAHGHVHDRDGQER